MIQFYHPNKAVKGSAASFWYSSRHDSLFATIMKQSGWDETNGVGKFIDSKNDPTKKVNIKLTWIEAAAILDCIERNREFTTYHDMEPPKSISFTPWMAKAFTDGEGNPVPEKQRGFSFTVTINNKEDKSKNIPFFIGLTLAEGRLVREYIINAMHKSFNRDYVAPAAVEKAIERVSVPPNNPAPKESNTVDGLAGL